MNQRMEQVERWANFVKNNPTKWKRIHTQFINAQFDKHRDFVKRLLKEPGGFEKLVMLYNIKNAERFKQVLKG